MEAWRIDGSLEVRRKLGGYMEAWRMEVWRLDGSLEKDGSLEVGGEVYPVAPADSLLLQT